MLRIVPLFVGGGLATLWTVALTLHTTTAWLAWCVGALALIAAAVMGLVPARGTGTAAGACMAATAMALFVLWWVALATGGAPWLTWSTLVAACITLLAAAALLAQGALDRMRSRPTI